MNLPPEPVLDEVLMARLQAGDEAALNELMVRWEARIKRYLGRIVQNTHEAEDLAQECFARVFQHRARFRSGARFSPWLYAIAANLARNRLRWWRRRPAISLEAWTEAGGSAAESGADASGQADAAERAEAVRAAVAELPLELREALVLCVYEGLAQADAATALGTTVKTVEMRLYRARARLRERLSWLSR